MAGVSLFKYLPFRRFSRDISVKVIPEKARVYHEFGEGQPILIEITNDSDREYDLELEVDFDDDLLLKEDGQIKEKSFTEELTIDSDRKPINLQLCHRAQEQRTAILQIEVSHEHGQYERDVECFLRT